MLKYGLELDWAMETERLRAYILEGLKTLGRRGLVVGVSGGIDSSVVLALAVKAVGQARVLALAMPERDSASESFTLAQTLAETFGVELLTEPLFPALEALGCYARQDEAIRSVFPAYQPGWPFKLVLPPLGAGARLNVTRLVVQEPSGAEHTVRLSAAAYRQLVAATNYKQRLRTTTEYYHADRLGYAVAGTPNRLEYELGFFVKGGDGLADLKPIAHLYKSQVFALAEYLGVPEAIRSRTPTTDTFPLAQTQEEFYFALPLSTLDACLAGINRGATVDEVAFELGVEAALVQQVYADLEAKRRVAHGLNLPPLLVERV